MSRPAVIESARCDRRPIMILLLILRRNNRTAKPMPRLTPSSTPSPATPHLPSCLTPTGSSRSRIDSVDGYRSDSARARFDLCHRNISLPRQRTSSVYTQYLSLISNENQSIKQTACIKCYTWPIYMCKQIIKLTHQACFH